ncbi:MAG: archease [Thermodesulfovibrionales bacterium]
MRQFEILDITGDAGIRAFGAGLEELFVNAAAGLYHLIIGSSPVRETRSIELTVEGSSLESLLVSWLNELIFQFDTYGFLGKSIVIREFPATGTQEGLRIRAAVHGEDFDEARHGRGLLVKAATYHRLKIEKTEGIYTAEIILDI